MRVATLLAQVQQTAQEVAADGAATRPARLSFWQTLTQPDLWAAKLVDFLPNVGNACLVLAFFFLVSRITRPLLHRALRQARFDESLAGLLIDGVYRWSLRIVAVVMAISQLGVNVTAAITGIGVAGIALGLAAQDSLANTVAGIALLVDRPFRVGHWISLPNAYGKVEEIRMRTTRIKTRQNTYVVIPNRQVADALIVNHSLFEDLRVDVPFSVPFAFDVAHTREAVQAAIEELDLVERGRSEVVVTGVTHAAIELSIRVWIRDAAEAGRARWACLAAARQALDAVESRQS